MQGVRIKSVPFEDLPGGCKVDAEARTIEFYGSVFGNRDSVGDVVDRGAFAKTISERIPRKLIKIFRNHYDPVGMPIELREDSFGLFCLGRIDKTVAGDECLEQCTTGTLAHASFMYRVMQHRLENEEGGEESLHLTELKLYETGPVNFPANELATILSAAKSGRPSHAALIDFALADLLAPAKAGLAALADRDHLSKYERREVSAALEDLAPFVRRLEEIEARYNGEQQTPAEAGEGGPEPETATTRDESGPESKTATTPEAGDELLLAEKLCQALEATRRLRDEWAA